jgi:hypothetical protein
VDGRLTLQAVSRASGAPEAVLAVPPWYGVPGVSAMIVPGAEVSVVFLDGDPAQPIVTAFHGDVTQITVGEGASYVALATLVTAQLTALKTAIANALPVALDGGAAFKAALLLQLAAWPGPIASTKLKSD